MMPVLKNTILSVLIPSVQSLPSHLEQTHQFAQKTAGELSGIKVQSQGYGSVKILPNQAHPEILE